jgi:hypothetical protein
MTIEIHEHLETPPEETPAPIVVETPAPEGVAMSQADTDDLARLRAEEAAHIEAEAEKTRRIAEQAQWTAEEALRVASMAEAEAVEAEVLAEEEVQHRKEEEPEDPEEDEIPNVDSAWFKKIGSK